MIQNYTGPFVSCFLTVYFIDMTQLQVMSNMSSKQTQPVGMVEQKGW